MANIVPVITPLHGIYRIGEAVANPLGGIFAVRIHASTGVNELFIDFTHELNPGSVVTDEFWIDSDNYTGPPLTAVVPITTPATIKFTVPHTARRGKILYNGTTLKTSGAAGAEWLAPFKVEIDFSSLNNLTHVDCHWDSQPLVGYPYVVVYMRYPLVGTPTLSSVDATGFDIAGHAIANITPIPSAAETGAGGEKLYYALQVNLAPAIFPGEEIDVVYDADAAAIPLVTTAGPLVSSIASVYLGVF
jgi:hypothetical protein